MESWCNVLWVNTQETHEGDVVLKNIMAAARSPGEPSRSSMTFQAAILRPSANAERRLDLLVDELKVTAHRTTSATMANPWVVWGMGLSDGNAHPPPISGCEATRRMVSIEGAGCTVSRHLHGRHAARWGTLNEDSRTEPAWAEVYAAMDVVQP